ncbi:MAG: hypothetical protein Q7J05_01040 [Paludibacter sp.]|nr:hypothetical protein [Paludibacter sp.]
MNNSLAQNNIVDIKSDGIIFPFAIEIDPMEKLLLVNFEKDPDSVYMGFEPQVFDDPINGTGHLIIGWRTDKKIDVYHQKSLKPDTSKYSIAGAGLNKMIPVDMEKAFYEVNDFGVQAHYKFRDMLEREVEISIRENNQRKRKPFGLLAPMGDAATHPTALPMVLLHDFYFVRKNETDIQVSINDKYHQLENLPIRMDRQKMTFVRYSPKPLIATFNPEFNGVLYDFRPSVGQETFQMGDYVYDIEWTDHTAFIKSMSVKNNIHMLTMSFSPSFPCLTTIPANTRFMGEFTITGHESVGSISGAYTIESSKESMHISLVPSKGWKPKTTKFSTWFLFSVAKVFKKWPTTYQWNAELHKSPEGLWYMQSKWMRTGKILKDPTHLKH